MSTATKTKTVYINQNGMAVCADHGGSGHAAALRANPDAWHFVTDLDDWMRFDNSGHECETCKRGRR